MSSTSNGGLRLPLRQSARTGRGTQSSTAQGKKAIIPYHQQSQKTILIQLAECTTGTLEEFHKFPSLFPEIRLQIWNEALLGARDTRTVIVNNDRVLPLKHLVSPLLSVNFESRACAQAFYGLKLDVISVPTITKEQILQIEVSIRSAWDRRGEGRELPDTLYAATLKNVLRNIYAQDAVKEADEAEHRKGAVYVSPEYDTLVVGYEVGLHFFIEGYLQLLYRDHPAPGEISWNYITAKLPEAAFQKTSSLTRVVVTRDADSLRHLVIHGFYPSRLFNHEFGPHPPVMTICQEKTDVDLYWKARLFPKVRHYYSLPLGMHEYNMFLQRIITHGGRMPYKIDKWVYYTGKHSKGITMLVNEREWLKFVKLKEEDSDDEEVDEAANANIQT